MAPTEEAADSTMHQRKGDHIKDQHYTEQNGDVPDHINSLIYWKTHIEGIKAELVEDAKSPLRILLDKAITEAIQSYKNRDKDRASVGKKRLQEPLSGGKKIFQHRASLLDDLMEVKHFQSIYHVFVAIFCIFGITKTTVDIIDQGRINLEFDMFLFAFGKIGTVAWSWMCLFAYSLLVPYKALQFWGSLYPKSEHKILLSEAVGTFLLVSALCVLGVFPIYVVKHYQLPPASSLIITLEQIRFMMKIYSFLRERVPVVLQKDKEDVQLPKFSSYLYFLFCPTFIYRDSYPRTPYIRWAFVFKNFAKFLACVFSIYYVMDTLCVPVFSNMNKEPFSTKKLVLSVFHAILPGVFVLFLTFYGFLHCWHNAFAEMLRFADRMFYKDWWNSTSFSNYYRTWNVIVHDWLFYYVYQDLLWLLRQRCRTGVMLITFLMSACAHEYALSVSFGYFYPVMFCLFAVLGVLFNVIINDKRKSPVFNVIVWTFLLIGQGIQLFLYCHEWYAHIHCPPTEKTFWGLAMPRSWSCHL